MLGSEKFIKSQKPLPARTRKVQQQNSSFKPRPLVSKGLEGLGEWAYAVFRGLEVPAFPQPLQDREALCYVGARAAGNLVADAWAETSSLAQSLVQAIELARAKLDDVGSRFVDALEICIAATSEAVAVDKWPAKLDNLQRGVYGIELRYGEKLLRYAPTTMLAYNFNFADILGLFRMQLQIDERRFLSGVQIHRFEVEQVLLRFGPPQSAMRLQRGDTVVQPKAVSLANVRRCADLTADFLVASVAKNGRMTYRWRPTSGDEPAGSNNALRQWMASIALVKLALWREDEKLLDLASRNIDYNLRTFYRDVRGYGIIEYGGMVKLGAVALAAQALAVHPRRDRWLQQGLALIRSVDEFANEDGSFACLWKPEEGVTEASANLHNFYPGEALLLWVQLYCAGQDKLLPRILNSFTWYEKFHRAQRRPAFVPWQSRARYQLFKQTKDPALAPFVFEMNDWLIDNLQQWESVEYKEHRGRFYNPQRPDWGPPHSASDGVYLEGLVDAYRMAVALNDQAHAERYRLAIARGLRNTMQLQFVDDVDMYYVAQRERTCGGIRAHASNNEIRIDNVQHNLMAMIEVLKTFGANDYSTEGKAAQTTSKKPKSASKKAKK